MASTIESHPSQQATGNEPVENPLVAALPPNTDYFTYLTLLEYQLTPQNLPTLNRLLQEDDGTLASEIGWDLLKLVLPILRVEPAAAQECLDIVARRGNPREVIVRVSEELERLGHSDTDGESDVGDGEDGLPTFAGEAPRVHLGDMTLGGMPELPKQTPTVSTEIDEHVPGTADEEANLTVLLSMLGQLHPRIKTQYPSRFLATSLPAALGAYRRLSKNTDTTMAFLNALTNLAGKKRPPLPPRASTADALPKPSDSSASATATASAPLPDPQSKSESIPSSTDTSTNEAAINQRLLQAVLLEIIDERTTTSFEAQPPLTARLRAHIEPSSLTPSRKAELSSLATSKEAKMAEMVQGKFITVAQDLKLDSSIEISKLDGPRLAENDSEDVSEYPTSPSQVPIADTGLLLLYSSQQNSQAWSSLDIPRKYAPISQVLALIHRQHETDSRLRQSAPAIDSILCLLYTVFCIPRSSPTQGLDTLLVQTFIILRDIFTSCPDQDLRDNAHHIATHILHSHCSRETRLDIIRDLLSADSTKALSPIHEAQSGNLRSIAVDWLKNELFPTHIVQTMMDRISDEDQRGLPVSCLVQLDDLLFPAPKIGEPPQDAASQVMDSFAVDLPFYISALNLLGLVAKHADEHGLSAGSAGAVEGEGSSAAVATDASVDIVLAKGEVMLAKLEKWKDWLAGILTARGHQVLEEDDEMEVAGIALPDVFALEDAIGRVREVLPAEI